MRFTTKRLLAKADLFFVNAKALFVNAEALFVNAEAFFINTSCSKGKGRVHPRQR